MKIPGKYYNQNKTEDGYLDENSYDEPYRKITNWFLTSKPEEIQRNRLELPENINKRISHLYLYGEVLPNCGRSKASFKVEITGLKMWSLDRHFQDRGIWVLSRNAWYKLEKPCQKLITLSNGAKISQDVLHQPLRAKCGLISNIIDMMSVSGILQVEFIKYHAERLPYQSYSDLCLTKEEKQMNPRICDVPFHFELLRRDPIFFKTQLKGLDARFSHTCAFMKGLSVLSSELKEAKNRKELWALEYFDYRASAEGAETRSNRYPWGCQKLDVRSKYDFS